MEEYRTKIGGNKLTKKEVKGNEDFGQLIKKHQHFVKKKKWIAGGLITAGVFLITALVLYFSSIQNKEIEVVTNPEEKKEIQSLFGMKLDKNEFVFEADKGGVFHYNNSVIEIPANVFVDSNGNVIEGEVSVFYKEFHSPVDFLLSGIPMTYDSAGTQFYFESAGMFDIRGEQNGAPVFLEKPLIVKMESKQEGEYFNKYYYDEENDSWDYIAKDEAIKEVSMADTTNILAFDDTEIDKIKSEITKIKKGEPKEKSPEANCIKLELNSSEFPEFNGFKSMLFEIDETDDNFSKELADIEWDDIKLRKKEEVFELLFFKKFKRTIIRTKPVYEGEDYAKALSVYKSSIKNTMDSLNNELDERLSSVSQFNNEVRSNSNLVVFVTRIFEVNNFGIYNSDYPCRMPKGQMIAAEYIEKSEKLKKDTLLLKQLYLVEENKNVMYTLFTNGTLSYNPNNKCVLWGVTRDDKLVICKAKEFAKIPLNYKEVYNLEFEVLDKDLYAEEKIKKELDIGALF